ncbi:site-specific integrase [Micromonospora sp. MED01]|nr:site-specific integrase [Micromonospora alfalfae]
MARQRHASSHTTAAYRDTFKLLLTFATATTGRAPSNLQIADLDAPMISAFLDHLETGRGNSARTRNARLAAIRSLFSYAALRHPEDAAVIQRVLAIPTKRFERAIVTYLTDPEIDALLDAPDQGTWTGRRDHALLALAIQTGLRATELTTLKLHDTHLGTGAHVSCIGKGRKQRITPLTKDTVTTLENWLKDRGGVPADPLFPTRSGTAITRDALERRVTKHAATAALACPTLAEKKISPHVLRHSAAMRLLNAGVDTTVIALWPATKALPQPRSISTPTSHSRNARWPEPRRSALLQGATSPPTRSSPSWRTCDYADATRWLADEPAGRLHTGILDSTRGSSTRRCPEPRGGFCPLPQLARSALIRTVVSLPGYSA